MNISDTNYNINAATTNISVSKPQGNVSGVNVPGGAVTGDIAMSANAKILQVAEGQLFNGIVSDINNNDVKIVLDNNQTLFAHMSEAVNLNIGDSITFMVKENDGASVTISPYAKNENVMKDSTIFKALELNNISPTEKNYNIADKLMQQNMPIDKMTMQKVMQQAYKYPDVSIDTLVTMNKLGIPVNETNISQFEAYMTNTHQLSNNISDFTDSIISFDMEMLDNMSGNADTISVDVINVQKDILVAISDVDDNKMIDGMADILIQNGFDEEKVDKLVTDSKTNVQFFDNLTELVSESPDIDKEAIIKMFTTDSYKELLKETVKDKFSVSPDNMNEPGEVDSLYRSMYEKADKLLKAFPDAGGKAGQQMGEQAKGMQERLNFIQELNNMYTYAQIPVKLSENMTNSELFVYMNKKSIKSLKDEVSAMLHLDMDNLGHTDVHVSLSNNIVHTKFYVSDEESARIIDEHISMLEKAINDSGYSLVNETITKSITTKSDENMVTKTITGQDMEKSVKRYSFDIRA